MQKKKKLGAESNLINLHNYKTMGMFVSYGDHSISRPTGDRSSFQDPLETGHPFKTHWRAVILTCTCLCFNSVS